MKPTSDPGTNTVRRSCGKTFRDGRQSPKLGNWLRTDAGKYNYSLLKLFALSVLWRASVSTRKEFEHVRLGPHESRILSMLKSGDAGDADSYGVIVARFSNMPAPAILGPMPRRRENRNYYQLLLGPYVVYVKTDKQPSPPALRGVQPDPNRPLLIPIRDPSTAEEFQILQTIVNEHRRTGAERPPSLSSAARSVLIPPRLANRIDVGVRQSVIAQYREWHRRPAGAGNPQTRAKRNG